ncbi:MAG: PQQ-dependent sugar dehydrogenase [Solirubrobacterales bacterium]
MKRFLNRRQTETAIAAFVAVFVAITGVAINSDERPGLKHLTLERLGRFNQPVHLTQPPGGGADLFVVEKPGTIRKLTDGGAAAEPFLDIRGQVKDTGKGGEQGMLSLAFAPDYADSGFLYVAFTGARDDLRVVEYSRDSANPERADPASGRLVMRITQPSTKHHGGLLLFGPDGHLYIGSGDGDAPRDVGQDKQVLLGKLLRIDPRPAPGAETAPAQRRRKGRRGRRKPTAYTIPPDNPLVGRPGRDEIFAYGLRNPWRFSFDRGTGAITIGDVGEERYEEVNYLPANKARGANFGWRAYEGFAPLSASVPKGRTVLPVLAYKHGPACAITGGHVIRDPRLSRIRGREVVGRYIYGDYCTGKLFAFRPRLDRPPRKQAGKRRSFKFKVPSLSSFGEDNAGRIYLLQQFGPVRNGRPTPGAVYRLDPARK